MSSMSVFRRIQVACTVAFLGATGAATAQSGLTYAIIEDSYGNVVAQLSGSQTSYSLETMLDATLLPGTVVAPPPAATPPPSAPSGWSLTGWGNGAMDIAAGGSGVWFTAASGSIYTASSGGVNHVGGGVAVRMAVDAYGVPWCVTVGKAIFRLSGGSWVQLPGAAIDIAVGGNNAIYILNPDGSLASYSNGSWVPFKAGGGGTRIAVDQSGNPWVVNAQNQIFRFNGTQWQQLAGAAQDISISHDGAVYVVGMQGGPGGFLIHQWVPSASNWQQIGVYGSVAAAASGGHVYVARLAGSKLPTIMR